ELRADTRTPEVELVELQAAGAFELVEVQTIRTVVPQVGPSPDALVEEIRDAAAVVEREVVVGNAFGCRTGDARERSEIQMQIPAADRAVRFYPTNRRTDQKILRERQHMALRERIGIVVDDLRMVANLGFGS